jgi:hypothetical protein
MMTGLEIAQAIVLPFAVHKCPHCLQRFWRLDVQKLIVFIGMVLITGVILYIMLHEKSEIGQAARTPVGVLVSRTLASAAT